jgi:hypothetical protein
VEGRVYFYMEVRGASCEAAYIHDDCSEVHKRSLASHRAGH